MSEFPRLPGVRPPRLRLTPKALVALLTLLLALGLAACGSDDDENSSGGSGGAGKAEAVEKAFFTGMVHHHESAIEMAKIAQQRGQDPFIKKLAGEIIATQERETGQMQKIYQRLFGSELKPDAGAHDGLGLSAEEAGMTHNEQTNEILRAADPFDRAFVDEMVPHHKGAIRMAQVVLKSTEDPALRNLAEGIMSTQEREVKEMNAFRTKEFGGPVPENAGHGGEEKMPADEEHGGEH